MMRFKDFPRLTWSVMAAIRGSLREAYVPCSKPSSSPLIQSYSTSVSNKPELRLGPNVPYQEAPIVNIKVTSNNTMFLMSDHNGKTVFWVSAGSVGFKNTKRGSSHASEMAGTDCGNRALALGVPKVRVKIKGLGRGRMNAVKGLVNSGLEILSITDTTPVPHNGCRPKKVRRI